MGYSLRLVSGYVAERTAKYWAIIIFGYIINLLALPLLALTDNWLAASFLIVAERIGKAIRVPARDAMLSYAGQKVGMGLGFGVHEALDRTGAMLGPIVVALVFSLRGSYKEAFAILSIPAIFALSTLFVVRLSYPQPKELGIDSSPTRVQGLPQAFWLYLIGSCFVAAGYADFALIAYHFQKESLLLSTWIPIAYALAMGMNAFVSVLLGQFYDRKGFLVLIMITAGAAFLPQWYF